ncbi:MAG: thioredoxin-like domain-containing protein [Bacteroidota bacterium]
MKQLGIFISVLLWAVLVVACRPTTSTASGTKAEASEPQKPGYDIKVNISNPTGTTAMLAYYYGDKQYIKDTVDIVNGSFAFQADTSLDKGIYLIVFPPDNKYFEVMVDKDQFFEMTTDGADFVSNMKVKGSKENELFYQDLNFLDSKRKEVEALNEQMKAAKGAPKEAELKGQIEGVNQEVKTYREKFVEDNPNFLFTSVIKAMKDPQVPEAPKGPDGKPLDSLFAFKYYKAHFFDGFSFQDDRLLRTPVFQQRVNTYIDRLTYRNIPDSVIQSIDYMIDQARGNDDVFRYLVVYFLNKYAKNKIMGMDAVYVHMVEKYYMSGDAYWVDDSTRNKMIERATALSPTIIGRPAPTFTVVDDKGRPQNLSRIDAKWTVIYFWDYGCGHCKKVTPKLSEAFVKYKLADKGVKILTININGDVEEWKEKLGEYGLNAEGIINCEDIYRRSGATKTYDIISTPRMYLLDTEKKVKGKQIGVPQLLKILSIEEKFDVDEADMEEIDFSDIEE